ncbi:MAG: DNA-3-methyladenine glycosylase, partial [bacterium]|nr:DNA-3-methyladenine glycosylase [bacterium]
MKSRRLSRKFFVRPTLMVAKDLLGKILVRKTGRKITRVMIIETEAYCGPKDLASHASRGRTKRTEIMFGPAGHAYIYLIYGMYHCLNVVTEAEGYPAAVLIRG